MIIATAICGIFIKTNVKADEYITQGWADYAHSKNITINHNFINTDLVYFPVLIHDNSGGLLGYVLNNASDIAFFSQSKAVQYNHEIEYYDHSTGELWAWVNITRISSSSDTVFWMYYSDPDGGYRRRRAGTQLRRRWPRRR